METNMDLTKHFRMHDGCVDYFHNYNFVDDDSSDNFCTIYNNGERRCHNTFQSFYMEESLKKDYKYIVLLQSDDNVEDLSQNEDFSDVAILGIGYNVAIDIICSRIRLIQEKKGYVTGVYLQDKKVSYDRPGANLPYNVHLFKSISDLQAVLQIESIPAEVSITTAEEQPFDYDKIEEGLRNYFSEKHNIVLRKSGYVKNFVDCWNEIAKDKHAKNDYLRNKYGSYIPRRSFVKNNELNELNLKNEMVYVILRYQAKDKPNTDIDCNIERLEQQLEYQRNYIQKFESVLNSIGFFKKDKMVDEYKEKYDRLKQDYLDFVEKIKENDVEFGRVVRENEQLQEKIKRYENAINQFKQIV